MQKIIALLTLSFVFISSSAPLLARSQPSLQNFQFRSHCSFKFGSHLNAEIYVNVKDFRKGNETLDSIIRKTGLFHKRTYQGEAEVCVKLSAEASNWDCAPARALYAQSLRYDNSLGTIPEDVAKDIEREVHLTSKEALGFVLRTMRDYTGYFRTSLRIDEVKPIQLESGPLVVNLSFLMDALGEDQNTLNYQYEGEMMASTRPLHCDYAQYQD